MQCSIFIIACSRSPIYGIKILGPKAVTVNILSFHDFNSKRKAVKNEDLVPTWYILRSEELWTCGFGLGQHVLKHLVWLLHNYQRRQRLLQIYTTWSVLIGSMGIRVISLSAKGC